MWRNVRNIREYKKCEGFEEIRENVRPCEIMWEMWGNMRNVRNVRDYEEFKEI